MRMLKNKCLLSVNLNLAVWRLLTCLREYFLVIEECMYTHCQLRISLFNENYWL